MSKTMKILCILLVLAMVVSVSACKKAEEGDTTTTTTTTKAGTTTTTKAATTTTTGEADPFAEHMDILYMGWHTFNTEWIEYGTFQHDIIESKFNVTMTYSPCPQYNKPTEFNLILAAGALPDGGVTSLTVKAPELVNSNYIRTIMKSDCEMYMPDYTANWLSKRPLIEAWQSKADGEFYALYIMQQAGTSGGMQIDFRLDWMENLGIVPKGNVSLLVPEDYDLSTDHTSDEAIEASSRLYITDAQYTWDEFVDILRAFVNQDPDQNGENDTYGMTETILTFMDGYFAFHVYPVDGMYFRWCKEPDGSAAPQIYSQAYKKFLEMHKALDDEGLLTPDYWTQEYGSYIEWWASGKCGVLPYGVDASTHATCSILMNDTTSKVLITPPIEGREGWAPDFMGGTDIGFLYINKNVDDAKYERLLRMYDYMYFSDEGRELLQYGEEGKHWFERNENGKPKLITKEEMDKLPVEDRLWWGAYTGSSLWYLTSPWDMKSRTGLVYQYQKDHWPAVGPGYYVFFGPGSGEKLAATEFENPDNAELKTTTYQEYVNNLLSGAMDPDTAYERMMSVLNSIGYQDYFDVVQDSMYLSDELLKGNMVKPIDIIQ